MRTIKIALILTYDGSCYDGWQDNKSNLSIEGLLKKAFYAIFKKDFPLDAASRTDKGVHAIKQVVITEFNPDLMSLFALIRALNSQLPMQIRILNILEVPHDFHPSLSVKKKTYQYQINLHKIQLPFYQNTHWHIPYSLNVEKMKNAINHFIGKKDFTGFSNTIKKENVNPVCHLEDISIYIKNDQFLIIELTADRFLYKMCRVLVGTLIAIGKGTLESSEIAMIFETKQRVRAGITAPAHGLYLKTLNYPEFAILN